MMSLFLLTSHTRQLHRNLVEASKTGQAGDSPGSSGRATIVDMVLGFHPDFAATAEPQPDRPYGSPVLQFNKEPAS
jgi:hypothetical protein